LNSGQRVGNSEAKIIVAMRTDDGAIDILHTTPEISNQCAVVFRETVPHRIGKIHCSRPCIDNRLGDLNEKIQIRAARVLRGELDVVAHGAGIADAFDGGRESFFTGFVQFVFQMDVAGREENVDAGFVGVFEGFGAPVDIFFYRPRQPGNGWRAYLRRYAAYGFEIAFRSDRETGFQNVDIETFQLARHFQLVFDIHAESGSLFTVAQCRIENDYLVIHDSSSVLAYSKPKDSGAQKLPSQVRRAAGSQSESREGWFQSRNVSALEPPGRF